MQDADDGLRREVTRREDDADQGPDQRVRVEAVQLVDTGAVPDFIDVDTAIDFYLIKEFTRDRDSDFYRSHYFSWDSVLDPLKPLGDRKFHFGPAWDFDRSAGNVSDTDAHSSTSRRRTDGPCVAPARRAAGRTYSTHWFVQLFKSDDLQGRGGDRWLELKGRVREGHLSETAALKAAIGVSAESDRKRWARNPSATRSRGTSTTRSPT